MSEDNSHPKYSQRFHEAADKITKEVPAETLKRRTLFVKQERLQQEVKPLAERRNRLATLANALTREGERLENGSDGIIPKTRKKQTDVENAIYKKTNELGLNNKTLIRAAEASLKNLLAEKERLNTKLATLQYQKSLNEKQSKENTQEILTINNRLKNIINQIRQIRQQLNMPLSKEEESSYQQILKDIENHTYNPINIPTPRKAETKRQPLLLAELLYEIDQPITTSKEQRASPSNSGPALPIQEDGSSLFEQLLADLDNSNTPQLTEQTSTSSSLKSEPKQPSKTLEEDTKDLENKDTGDLLEFLLQNYYASNAVSAHTTGNVSLPPTQKAQQSQQSQQNLRRALITAVNIIKEEEDTKKAKHKPSSPAPQLTEPVRQPPDRRRLRRENG